MRPLRRISLLIILATLIVACRSMQDSTPVPVITDVNDPAPGETLTTAPTPTSPAAPSPTPLFPLAILIKPPETGFSQADQIETTLSELANSEELRFQVRPSLEIADLNAEIRFVVALPPDPGLSQLAGSAPQVQFLGIGIADLEPADNLTVISPQGASPDEIGFLAGYIAAVISPEWRVGVISTSDSPAGVAARNGFLNGVVYFCGLCRQTYPPYYDYPLYVELPADSSSSEWQIAADSLRDRLVKTVYVPPQVGDQSLLEYLASAEINIISASTPPQAIENRWVASLQPDYIQPLQKIWPDLIQGNAGELIPISLHIKHINEELFTPGRQMLVDEFMRDLQNGYVDTGVDPTTGEIR